MPYQLDGRRQLQSIDKLGNKQLIFKSEIVPGKMDETSARVFSSWTNDLALALDASLSLLNAKPQEEPVRRMRHFLEGM